MVRTVGTLVSCGLLFLSLTAPGPATRDAKAAASKQDKKADALDIRTPKLDADGRFHLYTDGTAVLPYVPYGWMPEEGAAMLNVAVDCKTEPYRVDAAGAQSPAGGTEACIEVKVGPWQYPNWCGIAFLSGPAGAYEKKDGKTVVKDPPWWGEDKRGWYYDLSGLKKKRLVFYARGATGKERIQVKFGVLGDKPHGDSVRYAPETPWLLLPTTWKRYELSLADLKPDELRRVCNGFTVVIARDQQEADTKQTQFFLDNIYIE